RHVTDVARVPAVVAGAIAAPALRATVGRAEVVVQSPALPCVAVHELLRDQLSVPARLHFGRGVGRLAVVALRRLVVEELLGAVRLAIPRVPGVGVRHAGPGQVVVAVAVQDVHGAPDVTVVVPVGGSLEGSQDVGVREGRVAEVDRSPRARAQLPRGPEVQQQEAEPVARWPPAKSQAPAEAY